MLRLLWCQKHRNTDFSKHIFTDETMIRLWDLPLYHCRLPSSYPEAIPCTTKYRKKVNICGGISFEGPTPFKVIKIINFVFLHFKNRSLFIRFLNKTWTPHCIVISQFLIFSRLWQQNLILIVFCIKIMMENTHQNYANLF